MEMKLDKRRVLIICILSILAIGCVGYANRIYEIKYVNKVKTGSVDVRIDQYEITGEGEKLIDPGEVMPNMDVSYIPRVTNLRAEGYIRVKAEIFMDKQVTMPVNLDYIFGMNEDWKRIGDYFYCTKVLKTGEKSDIFEGFNVPYQWTEKTASGFIIKLTADVVQADFITPDFNSVCPWGTIEIQKAKVEDNITYGSVKEIGVSPSWTYTTSTGFETTTSNLFDNFDHFMAGDSFRDTLEMKNEASNDIKVYFHTDNINTALIEKIVLKVYCDGKTIYEGSLASESMNNYFYLTTISSGNTKNFDFEVLLPDDSKNYYSVLEDNVVWEFKVSEIEKSVRTGDEMDILPIIVAVIISLFAATFLLITHRKDRKNGQR